MTTAVQHTTLPPPPALLPLTQVICEVGALVTLGLVPHGERRYVLMCRWAAARCAGQS